MSPRDPATAPSPAAELLRLRGRLQELSPGWDPAAAPGAADDAVAPLRGVLGEASSAFGILRLVGRAIHSAIRRPSRHAAPPPRRLGRRRTGPPGWLRRHPFAAAAVLLGAGLTAYRLARGQGPGRARPPASQAMPGPSRGAARPRPGGAARVAAGPTTPLHPKQGTSA